MEQFTPAITVSRWKTY